MVSTHNWIAFKMNITHDKAKFTGEVRPFLVYKYELNYIS